MSLFRRKDEAKAPSRKHMLPIRMSCGTLAKVTAAHAESFARGYVKRHFTAHEICYVGVHKLDDKGTWIWEAHEGGGGYGCAASVSAALSAGANEVFVALEARDGKFVTTSSRQPGWIEGLMQSESNRSLPTPGIEWNMPMKRYDDEGRGVQARGLAAAAAGLAIFAVGALVWAAKPRTEIRTAEIDGLHPLTQIGRVESVPDDHFLVKVKFRDGKWSTETQPRPLPGDPPAKFEKDDPKKGATTNVK